MTDVEYDPAARLREQNRKILRWLGGALVVFAPVLAAAVTIWILTAPSPVEVCAHDVTLDGNPTDTMLVYKHLSCVDRVVQRRADSFLRIGYASWARCAATAVGRGAVQACGE